MGQPKLVHTPNSGFGPEAPDSVVSGLKPTAI